MIYDQCRKELVMSRERAKAFIQQVNASDTLQHRIIELNGDLNGLLQIAAEHGYSFTADDWSAIIDALVTGELDEADLEHVVGGVAFNPAAPSPVPIPYPNWWPK
jgi:predicted ribosomally synthesized peptide with nif11-like leader